MKVSVEDDDKIATEADAVVCMTGKDSGGRFSDDVATVCALCGCDIHHRPHVPEKPKKICINCATAKMEEMRSQGEEPSVMVTKETLKETAKELGMTPEETLAKANEGHDPDCDGNCQEGTLGGMPEEIRELANKIMEYSASLVTPDKKNAEGAWAMSLATLAAGISSLIAANKVYGNPPAFLAQAMKALMTMTTKKPGSWGDTEPNGTVH